MVPQGKGAGRAREEEKIGGMMGCDIHMYCETKGKNGKWKPTGAIFDNEYYDPKSPTTICDGYTINAKQTEHPYSDRAYNLFALLAGVRNGTWGEPLTPISEPRGLPEDASEYIKKEADCSDYHSHSWLTIKELLSAKWRRIIKLNAHVSKEAANAYRKNGTKPQIYSAWSSHGVNLEWEDEYYPAYFVEKVIPQIAALRDKPGVTDVRIVFWFDN